MTDIDRPTNDRIEDIIAAQEEIERRKVEAKKAREQRIAGISLSIGFMVGVGVCCWGLLQGKDFKSSAIVGGVAALAVAVVCNVIGNCTAKELLVGALLIDAAKRK